MSTPLVTPDGFPRSDIDVAQVMFTRTAIIRRRNDLKDLMKRLEKEMHLNYARLKQQQQEQPQDQQRQQQQQGVEEIRARSEELAISPVPTPHTRHQQIPSQPQAQPVRIIVPFAVVDSVAPGSPASTAVRAKIKWFLYIKFFLSFFISALLTF